jgi:hypothetical protein
VGLVVVEVWDGDGGLRIAMRRGVGSVPCFARGWVGLEHVKVGFGTARPLGHDMGWLGE